MIGVGSATFRQHHQQHFALHSCLPCVPQQPAFDFIADSAGLKAEAKK